MTPSRRAVVYVRISQDRTGEGLGVHRQEDDCRALCARLGWDVHEVIVDNDVSAYSRKRRPGYERLLDLLKNGEANALVAWHPDRLHRRPAELEAFIELVEAHHVEVVTVTAGERDLSTPTGRLHARIEGAVARHESEHKAERQRRKHQEMAEAGRPSGGGRRAFGYDRSGLVLVPHEAAAVRHVADMLLAGHSIRSCTAWLQAEGPPTVTGRPWVDSTVRDMMLAARIAGVRAIGVRAVNATQRRRGREVPAVWPAIITPGELAAIRAAVADRSGRLAAKGRRAYLLSGFVFCGACGAKMGTRPTSSGRGAYACRADRGGCGHVGVDGAHAEDEVVKRLLLVVRANPDPGDRDALAAEQQRLEGQLAEVERRYIAEGSISRLDYWRETDALRRLLEDASVRAAAASRPVLQVDVGGAWWDLLGLPERRRVLAAYVRRVAVAPVGKGGHVFQPERITVDWLA